MPSTQRYRPDNPLDKIHAINAVKDLIGRGESLSTNLRMSRFSPVGGRVKKPAVDWMCLGKQTEVPGWKCSTPETRTFVMKLKSRMMVNHSGGVMENATLALHPHFGTPFIPGSALKGIAGHAAWDEWYSASTKDKQAIKERIIAVFGFPVGNRDIDSSCQRESSTERSGTVAFIAAECVGTARLETDLINSHESEDRPPAPVFFPAVAADTRFRFQLVPLMRGTPTDMNMRMDDAEQWLKTGLQEYGAGAKTNAGYGWFGEVA